MNINQDQITEVLNKLPYPISKDELVNQARQHGVSNQVAGVLDKLPNKTFNSAKDVQNAFGNLGNLGNLKS